jgi:hypothetical protein
VELVVAGEVGGFHAKAPGRESKRFFFEKKNQKTFVPAGCGAVSVTARSNRSFFASFFAKKEALTFCYAGGVCVRL